MVTVVLVVAIGTIETTAAVAPNEARLVNEGATTTVTVEHPGCRTTVAIAIVPVVVVVAGNGSTTPLTTRTRTMIQTAVIESS
uniref:Putative secreted protein n=1 Tax=Anopheles darlingi TaxID=43151 RepID=A0A2M4DDD2_ANODA